MRKFFIVNLVVTICVIAASYLVSCKNEDSLGSSDCLNAEECLASKAKVSSPNSIFFQSQTRGIATDDGGYSPCYLQYAANGRTHRIKFELVWDGWGHGTPCDGFGICHFSISFEYDEPEAEQTKEPISPAGEDSFIAPLVQTPSNRKGLLIALDNAITFNERLIPLSVDSDIERTVALDDAHYATVTLVQGNYSFDSTIGTFGGYFVDAELTMFKSNSFERE